MKAISRITIATIVVVVVIVAAVGSFAYLLNTSSKQVELKFVYFSGNLCTFLQYAAHQFDAQHPGVKVEVVGEPFSDYVSTQLTTLEAHSSQYDLVGFTSTSAQSFTPYLLPLNSTQFNFSDLLNAQEFFGGVVYNTTTGKQQYYGVALTTAVYLMIYNETIFDNQTLANQFEQEYHVNFSPLTWQNWTDVVDADQFLTSHHITKYGFLIDDHESHGIIDAFPAVFYWYYSRDSNLTGGNPKGIAGYNVMFTGYVPKGLSYPIPSFNSTAGVDALQTYAELISYEPSPTQLQVDYDNIITLYEEGVSPGAFVFSTQIAHFPTNVSSTTGIAPLPGGYMETGTDFLGVSRFSHHKALAIEFLQFLLSKQMQETLYYKFHDYPVSKSVYPLLLSNTSLPETARADLQLIYQYAQLAYANPPNIPPTYSYLIPSFNGQVYNYLTGQETNATLVLQNAAKAWTQQLG
ncbi:hypothetical protein HS1genome_0655 [Sulfodiicoccus acidiphilus]|uniref:Sugar ABC transporter substrate-binding protein n=1 Tax=Sulfodiicoccus acidiphilus TaxID=1670455 RepID=A0A348B264_9CREN|nr:extracellular solute-binding protein [Sulfodiicoccus acidiphilus]BBD72266.1 hypothetical protein HS1genome_0655 [Sulfodiicoccus acidiphilus]GGT90674.1 hypothetical protein GCM10007116_05650 [Sulfodiicoccus acidiphilus]